MDRVSTAGGYQSTLLSILTAQNRQDTAQQQVTTGKIADDLKGYAANAEALTAARSLQSRNAAYVANGSALSDKLTTQDQALSSVATATQGARQAVAEALATGDATALLTTLQGQLGQATSALNTQYDGKYLFAGAATDTAPVDATQLSDLSGPGGVASVFKNGAATAPTRLDDTTTLQTGVLANQVATPLFTALQSVANFSSGAGGPLAGKLTTAQSTFLQGVLSSFDSAYSTVNEAVAQNGVVQDQVTASQTTLKTQAANLTSALAGLTNADPAQAATNLQLAQTALQASAQVFVTLQSTSLLSVLGSSGGG